MLQSVLALLWWTSCPPFPSLTGPFLHGSNELMERELSIGLSIVKYHTSTVAIEYKRATTTSSSGF